MTEARAALLESFTPEKIQKQIQGSAVRIGKELARKVPSLEGAALSWIDQFNKGKFVVEVDTKGLEKSISSVSDIGRQATVGVIVVGQLIGTAIVMAILLQPSLTQFQGLAYLAMIAFAVTLIVSFVVLFRLFFARRRGEDREGLCDEHPPSGGIPTLVLGAGPIIRRQVDWGIAMADVTAEFFDRLAERGTCRASSARPARAVRPDRDGRTEHWRVEFRRGAVAVSRSAADADCVVRTDAEPLRRPRHRPGQRHGHVAPRRLGRGRPELLVRFQRLFPAPTGGR